MIHHAALLKVPRQKLATLTMYSRDKPYSWQEIKSVRFRKDFSQF